MNDTFTILHDYDVEEFTEHINIIDPHIKFTIETEKDNKLPFLDLPRVCTHILDDELTKITIYWKPTHTDQYLNFKSHHPLTNKCSVVCTLDHQQGKAVCHHSWRQEIRTVTCPQCPESQWIPKVGACTSTFQCKKTRYQIGQTQKCCPFLQVQQITSITCVTGRVTDGNKLLIISLKLN